MSDLMEKIVSLCKRRGFIFPSSEIYGGFRSSYDFGPLGVELKNNIKKAWWDEMIKNHDDIAGLDASILMSPKVWEASGHLSAGFADELVECKECHKRFRKDFLEENKCPDCQGELTEPRKFNLMMKTFAGPVEDEAAVTYLRAETCQGIYMNYENVLNSMRLKIPFGICQIGKAFRNEINPKDFIYRTREFEQIEMQWFCRPSRINANSARLVSRGSLANKTRIEEWGTDEWFEYWKKERMKWYLDLGIKKENIRFREHVKDELAHYAQKAVDVEYKFPFGWKEIEGIHDRGDWDLSNHSKYSGKDLSYFDEEAKEKYIPHIIETSGGVDRSLLAFLIDAYEEVKGARTKTTKASKEEEIVLHLDKRLAPIKVAVLPLVRNKEDLVKKTKEIYQLLKTYFICQYDEVGSIGRRYRRQDEIATPFCITVDFETLKQDDVTVRDRDTMKQERIKINELVKTLKEKLEN
ncbi:MAG: glycine--tRNA ligase [Parcubacteria group bacterium CG11_big_fil_rev_8_21_14_0_20_39_14]|nr:MAG: glycine--tRNA ligase [Parcubacteria group bacterium CG11_big_fil_rev_8_21_14_0_20_39_14]PIS35303.1 MAG: glycine--tRNA ligase [Parcubacteria group bacterium CG08_land_8_20_14_0_20_38_56]